MDRSKIKDAARLDAELDNLSWLIDQCIQNGRDLNYDNLMLELSPAGKAAAWAAILHEANKDRAELELKIAEL